MKITNNTFGKAFLFAATGLTLSFTSCTKDDIESGDSVNVKIVNAAESSSPQDVFINDTKINSSAVAYIGSTGYIATPNSGNDRKIEFKTSGSADIYATEDEDLRSNKNYTLFLTGTGASADIEVVEDDLSAPAAGKAKVRFIHVSSATSDKLDIYTGTNTKVFAGAERGTVSNFVNIDSGVTAIGVLPAGTTDITTIKSLTFENLQAGKIYTIMIYGSTGVNASVISHN